MISAKGVAWLAGLLEGEGCFTWQGHTHNRSHGAIRITLAMCDRDVIERAAALLGCGYREYRHNCRDGHVRKTQYRIQVGGRRAASWMMTIYALMGTRRQEKISEILSQWKLTARQRADRLARNNDRYLAAPQAA